MKQPFGFFPSRKRQPHSPILERIRSATTLLSAVLLLNACASWPSRVALVSPAAPTKFAENLPAQWQAPFPHDGQLTDLSMWWQQFNDPVLTKLIDAAQAVSPTLASAKSRIAQSQATRVATSASLLPSVNGSASANRGRQDLLSPLGTSATVGVSSGWELDLFGANRAAGNAAQARLEGAQAAWHDARVSVAAEVANDYIGLRACEAQLAQLQFDATSRNETSRLTGLLADAGFQAPANAALARASAAQGNGNLLRQQAQCDLDIKALVALTAIDETTLRSSLTSVAGIAPIPQPPTLNIASLPAEALAQRPDVYSAAKDVIAASADVASSEAQRYPKISLSGNIGAMHIEGGGASANGTVWSIGPIAVSLPLFDGGIRRANVEAARARYDEASVLYAAKLRGAVREVENALITLQSTAARETDAQLAAGGFNDSYRATEARYRSGLASLFELEDARRTAVTAQTALIDLQQERVTAWVSLYRAMGGGWKSPEMLAMTAAKTQ